MRGEGTFFCPEPHVLTIKRLLFLIVSLQANIRNIFFEQRFLTNRKWVFGKKTKTKINFFFYNCDLVYRGRSQMMLTTKGGGGGWGLLFFFLGGGGGGGGFSQFLIFLARWGGGVRHFTDRYD